MDYFIQLYKEYLVRMNWKNGRMSRISSYNDIPSIHICPLDVEAWGEIFELELSRWLSIRIVKILKETSR